MQSYRLNVASVRALKAAPVSLGRRGPVRVRCDDEETIPLGRIKKRFTPKEYEQLANPKLLGGKTVGDELALIRERYLEAEKRAAEGEARLSSSNWDGDVYIGGRWNTLSVLYLVFLLTPIAGLMVAMLTRGTLWDTGAYF